MEVSRSELTERKQTRDMAWAAGAAVLGAAYGPVSEFLSGEPQERKPGHYKRMFLTGSGLAFGAYVLRTFRNRSLETSLTGNSALHLRYPITRIAWPNGFSYPLEDVGDDLCIRCRSLDLEKAFTSNLGNSKLIRPVRELRARCPLCRVIGEFVDDASWRPFKVAIKNQPSLETSITHSPYERFKTAAYSTGFDLREAVKRKGQRKTYTLKVCEPILGTKGLVNWIGELRLIAGSLPSLGSFLLGRVVDPFDADLDRIRYWLRTCWQVHGRSCEESGDSSDGLPPARVIDVVTRRVVRPDSDCRYLALSYVWGSYRGRLHFEASERDLLPFQLPHELPRTIEDAIHVTRVLQERYLWVDAICIPQEEGCPEKIQELRRMDTIYGSAALTLVDASGDSSNAGLAGVSRPRKYCQRRMRISRVEVAVPFPEYTNILSDPSITWNTRRWTLQETVLSKRLLLFTDYQAYWQCSNMVWCEDAVLETTSYSTNYRKAWRPLRWAPSRSADHPDSSEGGAGVTLDNYIAIIERYTSRSATKVTDVVQAISGVLNTFSVCQICGMPDRFLGPALLWQPRRGAQSKMIDESELRFPTWSWARWDNPGGCSWESNERGLQKSSLAWPILLRDGKIPIIDVSYPHAGHFDPRADVEVPTSNPAVRSRLKAVGAMLFFPAQIERLYISGDIGASDDQENGLDQHRDFSIMNSRSECVGYVRMTANMRREHSERRSCMFLRLCKGEGYPEYAPQVSTRHIPTESDGDSGTKPRPRGAWKVEHVVLVRKRGPIFEREALGMVIRAGWPGREEWRRKEKAGKNLKQRDWVLFA